MFLSALGGGTAVAVATILFVKNKIEKLIDKKINYTYKEYMEHLKQTNEYTTKVNNYEINYVDNKTFKNITITFIKNHYVIISKSSNPTIHFVIEHPKLVEAIENFNPLIKE